MTGQAQGALVKLRAAGVEVDHSEPPVVESRVRAEPAFTPLVAAVQAHQAVQFSYRRSGSAERLIRTLEPWGVVSWRARWYVVGHDRDRAAPRCFRLSRIVGDVRTVGRPGEVQRPENVNLLELIAGTGEPEPSPVTTAKLWIADQRAAGVRRRARLTGRMTVDGVPGDLAEIDLYFPESAADWIAGHGPDVLVLEPDVLAKAVRGRLESILHHEVRR